MDTFSPFVFQGLGEIGQSLGGIGPAVEEHVFHAFEQLFWDFFIDFYHTGIDDAHIHARLYGVVEKSGVHRFPDDVVAAVGERDIADAPGDFCAGAKLFDLPGGFDEVQGIIVVFFDTGCHGEDIGVKDDIFRWEADLCGEDAVSALADVHFSLDRIRLSRFVKGHDDGSGPVAAHEFSLPYKLVFTFFQGDRVDDALPLYAL